MRQRIAPGIFGLLESPQPDDDLQDCVSLGGWAFSRDVPIAQIIARGLGPDVQLEYRMRRDDVAAVYAQDGEALFSGFSGYVERQGAQTGKPAFEIWARLQNGREVRLFTWSAARARFRRWVRSSLLGPVRDYLSRAAVPISSHAATRWFERSCRLELQSFLDSGARIVCPQPPAPRVTVVIALWNRAELTLRALRSVCEERDIALDVVLVNNASTDETPLLLTRISGATVLTNPENVGFTLAANQGAEAARGELLLFLNSDAVLHPGALLSLTRALDRSDQIGAVGGKLIWPNGRLQEAGAAVWRDGSCEAHGRNRDPADPEYSFERDVDFCSGAMLLTRRDLFLRLGGFDDRYKPAYYEDVDYCVRLLREGFRVVYTPTAAATHVEFASSASAGDPARLQRERQAVFVGLHGDWLAQQPSRSAGTVTPRSRAPGRPRAVIVDDVLPDPALGAGFPRAAAMLHAFRRLGWHVTIYPTSGNSASRRNPDFPDVDVRRADGPRGLGPLFKSLPEDTRVVIVSRAHNMRYVKAAAGRDLAGVGCPVIYDVEALPALREIARRRLGGTPVPDADAAAMLQTDLGLARGCAAVFAVSPSEQRLFLDAGLANVSVLGHAVDPSPTGTAFGDRRSLLFVGAFSTGSPNEDAVRFLMDEVQPALRGAPAGAAPLVIAGANIPGSLRAMTRDGVEFQPDVPDLKPLYDAARVFVAPTRYSAGIPLKLIDAAAHGVPIVCTTELARQLGWTPGVEVLAADRPEEIARLIATAYGDEVLWHGLRESALRRVAVEYSPADFESRLKTALERATRL